MTTTDKEIIWKEAYIKFIGWLKNKPTGSFSLTIPVNQGGVRGKPKYEIKEDG